MDIHSPSCTRLIEKSAFGGSMSVPGTGIILHTEVIFFKVYLFVVDTQYVGLIATVTNSLILF